MGCFPVRPSWAKRAALPLLIGLGLWAGCRSNARQLATARQHFGEGRLDLAASILDESAEKRLATDRDCVLLDQAVVRMARGEFAEAEATLRDVRDRFDELELRRWSDEAAAMLTDDNRRAYAGEDYERVLIRVYLALANLMREGDDAVAYCLQVEQKQKQIIEAGGGDDEENPKLAYKQVAIGAYLHGVVREATHLHYDDALHAFAKVASWEPSGVAGQIELHRLGNGGVHSAPGHGVVYVFALVGQGPTKVERIEKPSSAALLIADRLLSALGKYSLPPTIAPIKTPGLVVPENRLNRLLVDVDQQPAGVTQTVTDVGQMALAQHEAMHSHELARAIVRRVVKKATVYASKDRLSVSNPLVNLAFDAAGVAWEATESADTRCWGLLPETIQVLRLELPVGEHVLALRPAWDLTPVGPAELCRVEVADGRNTYVLAQAPGTRLANQVRVSGAKPDHDPPRRPKGGGERQGS